MRWNGIILRGRCQVGGLRQYKDRRRESLTKRSPGASLTGSSSSKIHLKGVKIYVCSKIFICLYIKLGSSVDKEKENAGDDSDWLIAVLVSTRRWDEQDDIFELVGPAGGRKLPVQVVGGGGLAHWCGFAWNSRKPRHVRPNWNKTPRSIDVIHGKCRCQKCQKLVFPLFWGFLPCVLVVSPKIQ